MAGKGVVLPPQHPPVMHTALPGRASTPRAAAFSAAVRALDLRAVQEDLRLLFKDSQPAWPADWAGLPGGPNYGPLMVRLAWHCSGSYRLSDGRGGCRGGRQRFDPERSWPDNTNLDKARSLLLPVKAKYGEALSWGDLFVLAGTTAIESMGGPSLGFCAGRVDDVDGTWSLPLGPSPEQEAIAPCAENGRCKAPLGSTTVGLIYLNPEGPEGNPDPAATAPTVRDSFGRMGMNDSETVALIGGGHAFGKSHGACPAGAGPPPNVDPVNPWPGECGSGKGADTYTSGFEGAWTFNPTTWDNSYFKHLTENQWEVHTGPGDLHQWKVKPQEANATETVAAAPGVEALMMLTSDVSLKHDAEGEYQRIIAEYARDPEAFDAMFAHAWYKLTTRDMGPATRCVGELRPPAQPWQYPLPPPPPPEDLPDFPAIADEIRQVLNTDDPALRPDYYDGVPNYGPLFVRLAWQCASTFRATDYLGGCNGARLRFSPQKDWPANAALDATLLVLAPIQARHPSLSWADLIVLAGTTALEAAGSRPLAFCGGRTDAADGAGSEHLAPRISGNASDSIAMFKDVMLVTGLSARETVALMGGGHSLGMMHRSRSGFEGSWTSTPTKLNTEYFRNLIDERWEEHRAEGNRVQYKAAGKDLYILKSDLTLAVDATYQEIVLEFAESEQRFLEEFAAAWEKVMNADRFDGPTANLCDRATPLSLGSRTQV